MKLANEIAKCSRVYLIGNGGSYANAVHFANDLLGCGIKAYTLDPATLTASANDYGYQTVFERWISVVGEQGDILIALSGSGKSTNVNRAVRKAKEKYMNVWGITGVFTFPHNTLARAAHHVLARGKTMQEAENYQLAVAHQVMKCLKP